MVFPKSITTLLLASYCAINIGFSQNNSDVEKKDVSFSLFERIRGETPRSVRKSLIKNAKKYDSYFFEKSTQLPLNELKSAVILVDAQDYFFTYLDGVELAQEQQNQIEVLNYCKINNIPVVVLESKSFATSKSWVFVNYGETTDELKVHLDDLDNVTYIKKTHSDGFNSTDLSDVLSELEVNSLYLMGVNASDCVFRTALSGMKQGYKIIVSKETMQDSKRRLFRYLDESISFYEQFAVHETDFRNVFNYLSYE